MKISLSSVPVDDQEKRAAVLHPRLGFQKKHDIPMGHHRWITVVSPGGRRYWFSLEPDEHPAVKPFKAALMEDGIPFTAFEVKDVAAEHKRLEGRGVLSPSRPPRWVRHDRSAG